MYFLYTYRDINELRRIQKEQKVYSFVFAETKKIIDGNPQICVDITSLAYYLDSNKADIQPAYTNFINMTEDTKVIIKSDVAELALSLLPVLFCDKKAYFDIDMQEHDVNAWKVEFKNNFRRTIYCYRNNEELDSILTYTSENRIPLATFSQVNGSIKEQITQFNKMQRLAIVDLTSISYAMEDNKNIIYVMEQVLESLPNISIIALTSRVDLILSYFPLFFDKQEPITALLPDLTGVTINETEEKKVRKVTDLDEAGFQKFCEYLEQNLIGHQVFKSRLKKELRYFITLNRVKEQKVYSMFLFGPSGIGKTEVARLIAEGLQKDCYLPKINFQNYSSQDSLNSLIGSPAGYVGCEHGELSDKLKKSNVGIVLCDEFEKTTRPVFSFFLELLEEGHFTDSMAREYDMDGFIIVFTSNILNGADYKKAIPPELQTRFDFVCEFEPPTKLDKQKFIDFLIKKAKTKYSDIINQMHISDSELASAGEFNYSDIGSLREIKQVFNKRIMKVFESMK